MSLLDYSATQLLTLLEAGQTSSVEIVQACLEQIARHDGAIGAFLRVDADAALSRAREIDDRRAR
jgi:aspartyl-tRNA(Asn)/glutamyl-tRNA(Gln) amidotransferase subunit A